MEELYDESGSERDDMDAPKSTTATRRSEMCGVAGRQAAFLRVPAEGKTAAWVHKAIKPGVKGKERATEKLEKDYGGMWEAEGFGAVHAQLCDVRRDDCGDWGVEEVGRVFGGAVKNKYKNPTPLGYRDLNLCVAVS